jgi:hypothetical protein
LTIYPNRRRDLRRAAPAVSHSQTRPMHSTCSNGRVSPTSFWIRLTLMISYGQFGCRVHGVRNSLISCWYAEANLVSAFQ